MRVKVVWRHMRLAEEQDICQGPEPVRVRQLREGTLKKGATDVVADLCDDTVNWQQRAACSSLKC